MGNGGAPTANWPALREGSGDGRALDPAHLGARLIVQRPDLPEVTIPVEKQGFIVGRDASEADLVLDDDLVSRRHAALTVDERGYFRLRDLGSRNGITYLGRRVERLNLLDGDTFVIGRTTLVFRASIPRFAAAERAPVAPPRADSVMMDMDVPIPRPARIEEANGPVGWDPARARRTAAPQVEEAEEPADETVDEPE